jgi:hypothetical protein
MNRQPRSLPGLLSLTLAQTPDLPPEIEAALVQWRGDVAGPTWEVVLDEETVMGRTLFNGRAAARIRPGPDETWFDAARSFLQQAHGILGVDGGSALTNVRVMTLPLGMPGGTDKVSVRFAQVIQGVPVRRGFVSALFDKTGNLLCLDSDGLPHLAEFDVRATVDASMAATIAESAFVAETGEAAEFVGTPSLVIAQRLQGSRRSGSLAWEVEVDGAERAILYSVQATGAPEVIERESLTHECFQEDVDGVKGTISGSVTAGLAPPGSGVPDWSSDRLANLTIEALPHLYVRRLANEALLDTTKSDGTFLFHARDPRAASSANERYGHGNDKESGFGEGVADVWAMYQADTPRLGLDDNPNNPLFATRYGDDRNHFCFCGDCPPAGVDHAARECLDLYSNADDHRDDFTNEPVGCARGTQGCHHGAEHGNGRPLMGALWKLRENLKSAHGADLGSAVANALFLGWMEGFTTPRIKNVIAYQFAILDGDGVLSQSPNFASIQAAFQARSFPGVQLPPVRATCH